MTANGGHTTYGSAMHDTPSQSERSFLLSAECACASLVAHGAVLLVALILSAGGRRLPADEREARVFFLLPPDRMPSSSHQSDLIQWGRLGGDLSDGEDLLRGGVGRRISADDHGSQAGGSYPGIAVLHAGVLYRFDGPVAAVAP